GDAGVLEQSLQLSADLVILHQVIAEVLLGSKPAAVPVFNNADTKSVRINFLAHLFTSSLTLSLSERRSCGWCASGCGSRGPGRGASSASAWGRGRRSTRQHRGCSYPYCSCFLHLQPQTSPASEGAHKRPSGCTAGSPSLRPGACYG